MIKTNNQATPDHSTHELNVVIVSKNDYAGSGYRYMKALRSVGVNARMIKEKTRTRIQEPVDIYLPDAIKESQIKQDNFGKSAVDIIKNKDLRDANLKSSLSDIQKIINDADIIIFKGDDLPCDNFLSYLSIPHDKPWMFIAGGSLYRLPADHNHFHYKVCRGGKIPLQKYRDAVEWMSGITADLCYDGFSDGYIPHAFNVADLEVDYPGHNSIIIVATPSSREKKGIDTFFYPALELVPISRSFEVMLIDNVTQKQAQMAKAEGDICFDQVGIGWYAFSAVESLSAGKPTIAWIDPKNIPASGMSHKELADIGMYITDHPTVEGLAAHIDNLLNPKPFQPKLSTRSQKAREFALKYHDYSVIGNKLANTARELIRHRNDVDKCMQNGFNFINSCIRTTPDPDKPKVLIFQYKPAIRCYKIAKTLQNQGWNVHFAGTAQPFDYYQDQFPFHLINSAEKLQSLAADFDILIHGNPNHKFCTQVQHPCRICAVGDVDSFRRNKPEHKIREQQVFNDFEGFMFVSRTQRDYVIESFNAYPLKNKSIILFNGVLSEWLPKRKIVYSGNLLHAGQSKHRDLFKTFKQLANSIEVHLYPGQVDFPPEYHANLPENIILHKRMDPSQLISEFRQYDAGLIWFNIQENTRRNLETALPNKLYEYLAAGLPVICQPLPALLSFAVYMEGDNVFITESIEDIPKVISNIFKTITYDEQSDKLTSFLTNQITK